MSSSKFVEKIFVILHIYFLTTFGYRFDHKDDDQNDSINWDNSLPPIPISMSMNYFDRSDQQLIFPELTSCQKNFGVNPGYQLFNGPKGQMSPQEVLNWPLGISMASNAPKDPNHPDTHKLLEENASIVEAFLNQQRTYDIYFTTVVAVSSALLAFSVVGAGICYHRFHVQSKSVKDVGYPTIKRGYKDLSQTSVDRKLAQNAQLFHFQHQKQQIFGKDINTSNIHRADGSTSDIDSDDEDGDFTVYECPGLAPSGDMEVRNPIFDDETPKVGKNPK